MGAQAEGIRARWDLQVGHSRGDHSSADSTHPCCPLGTIPVPSCPEREAGSLGWGSKAGKGHGTGTCAWVGEW